VESVAFSPDGKSILLVAGDSLDARPAKQYDIETGKLPEGGA